MNYVLFFLISYSVRCSYHYNALGHLHRKNCSDFTSFQYLIDPFGQFGADIIAEVWLVLQEYLTFSVSLKYLVVTQNQLVVLSLVLNHVDYVGNLQKPIHVYSHRRRNRGGHRGHVPPQVFINCYINCSPLYM